MIPGEKNHIGMLLRYKAWADQIAYESVHAIPQVEQVKPRQSTFGNILHTLNHVYVVDDIFRHHLTGRDHRYEARNTAKTPPLEELWATTRNLDAWYIDAFDRWTPEEQAEPVEFTFVGGGQGTMTRAEIALHVVNHTTYHRGFVGDMLKQVPFYWQANDLTVFLRDHYRRGRHATPAFGSDEP